MRELRSQPCITIRRWLEAQGGDGVMFKHGHIAGYYVDKGMGKDLSTLTGNADLYAFSFDQKGLMAAAGL